MEQKLAGSSCCSKVSLVPAAGILKNSTHLHRWKQLVVISDLKEPELNSELARCLSSPGLWQQGLTCNTTHLRPSEQPTAEETPSVKPAGPAWARPGPRVPSRARPERAWTGVKGRQVGRPSSEGWQVVKGELSRYQPRQITRDRRNRVRVPGKPEPRRVRVGRA